MGVVYVSLQTVFSDLKHPMHVLVYYNVIICRVPMMWSAGMHQLQLVLCRYVFHDKSGGNGLVKIRYKYVLMLLDSAIIIIVFLVINPRRMREGYGS